MSTPVMGITPSIRGHDLPTHVSGATAPGYWGVISLIATEAALFGSLIFGYFYLASGSPQWPPLGLKPPDIYHGVHGTILLFTSSIPMTWADLSIRRGKTFQLMVALAITMTEAAFFLGLELLDYAASDFGPQENAYASLFFTITGIHALHVFIGILLMSGLLIRAWCNHFTAKRHMAVQNVALYWHFVGAVWAVIFSSFWIFPRVI
ncbi:MAG: heme-copper oxidase subunit III [Chloroflexi bacterium]|nr:heme-copper oxidase subunit III [Chloroflexota bacterium]